MNTRLTKSMIFAFAVGFTLECLSAEPIAPFQSQSTRPSALRRTSLAIRVSAVTNIIAPVFIQHTNDRTDTLVLPIRIENRSQQVITTQIAHEWYGGEWPPTGMGAAVRRLDDPSGKWRVSEVYLVGELGSRSGLTTWQPGQARDFELRMNWRGTGSVRGIPLIETSTPGKYAVRLSLVFKSDASSEYFESDEFEVIVKKKEP